MALSQLVPADAGDAARGKINTAFAQIDNHAGRITSLEGQVTQLSGAIGGSSGYGTRITNLEQNVGVAYGQRITAAETYLTTLNGGVSLHTQQINSMIGAIAEVRGTQAGQQLDLDDAANTASAAFVQALSAAAYPYQGRPGDRPTSYTRSDAGGDPSSLAALDSATLSQTPSGASAVLSGADIILDRAGFTVEDGRRYQVRWRVRRLVGSSDPANDAVAIGLAIYDRFRAKVSGDAGKITFATLTNLTAGQVVERTAVVARTAGTGVDIVLGSGSQIIAKPFAQSFGAVTTQTHVEVLSVADITDLGGYSPDLTALTARVGAVEAANAGPRLNALEAAAAAPETFAYTSVTEAQGATVPASVQYLNVRGLYFRRASAGQFQSQDGAFWDPVPVVQAQTEGPVLTLAQGNPLPTTEYRDQSTVYAHPGSCDLLGLYDGALWIGHRLTELALPLGSANYVAGTNHSVHAYLTADGAVGYGTIAWAGSTAQYQPGAGAGTGELELFQGRWVNKYAVTLRTGSATVTVPARQALYIGCFGITGAGLTEDSFAKRLVSSVFDRRQREMKYYDPAYSWIYNGPAFVQANNGNGFNQLEYMHCLPGRSIEVEVADACSSSLGGDAVSCNIGLNSTGPIADLAGGAVLSQPGVTVTMAAKWKGAPGQGRQILKWLEIGSGQPGSNMTWLGNAGLYRSGISAWI